MIEAFLLGLSTGPSCMLFCGPVALPLFMSEMDGLKGQGKALLRFLTGRLIGYILAGFILGLAGQLVLGYLSPAVKDRFMIISYLLAGLFLSARALTYLPKEKGICQGARKWIPRERGELLLGLATGLSLCPPFVAMASRVLEGPVKGMISFFFFFLGTSVYLTALLLLPVLKKHRTMLQGIGRITMLLMGGYFLIFLFLLNLGRW